MNEWSSVVLAGVVMGIVGSSCSHIPEHKYALAKFPECRQKGADLRSGAVAAREAVEDWLDFEPLPTEGAASRRSAAAIRSYPQAEGALREASYLYDNALALLWFTWTGDDGRAGRLAELLIGRQRTDGSWPFRFELGDIERSSRQVRSGAVAWAAHALAYFGERTGSEPAVESARRAADFLWSRRRVRDEGKHRGLITAGYQLESSERVSDPFVATEHQFDAHMVFARFDRARATALEKSIERRLWLADPGRFAMGADATELDRRRALDAAGAWGALWLESIGYEDAARSSLGYTLETFPASDVDLYGFRPYLDRVGSYQPDQNENHVFVEGSMSVAVAALRLGRRGVAERVVRLGVQLQCMTGGGLPYSNRATAEFAATPAAASSVWFLFVVREWSSGARAPVFRGVGLPTGEQVG